MSVNRLFSSMFWGALVASSQSAATPGLTLIDSVLFDDGGAEIVAYSPFGTTLAATTGSTVRLFDFSIPSASTLSAVADFSAEFGGTIDGVSSTALDAFGRGFGAATLIPSDNRGTLGKVGFYDYLTGAVLSTVDVGYHPDSVLFSDDGSKLFVINEGEFTVGGDLDAPGSLSIIDLRGVASFADLATAPVMTYDFTAPNLGAGVDLSTVRYNDFTFTAGNEYRHLEPEFATQAGDKLYITMQENNAVAEFDLSTNQWSSINNLGTIEQTIDASDRDGIDISDTLKGLPMPDTIVSYEVAGITYYITANEGDNRVDDGDRSERLKEYDASMFEGDLAGIDLSNDGLGRVRVLTDFMDTDGNGLFDQLVLPGTRSISIWDAGSGAFVADTGSLEPLIVSLDPDTHNMEDGDPGEFDGRSDAKGPEPEGLALFEHNDSFFLAVGNERQNSIMLFDVTDPTSPLFVDYINNWAEGQAAPEGLLFVDQGPLTYLVVGYENSGYAVYGVVPEPSAVFFMGLPFVGALLLCRRRR